MVGGLLRPNHAVGQEILNIDQAYRDVSLINHHELVDLSLLYNPSGLGGEFVGCDRDRCS